MLAIPVIVIIAVFVFSLTGLFFVIYRHKGILQHIRHVFSNASAADLNAIYSALTDLGTASGLAHVLARTNTQAESDSNIISLPGNMPGFPWAGKVVHITPGIHTSMVINNENSGQVQLGGRVYTCLPVPTATSPETGQRYIQHSPYKWLDQGDVLSSAARHLSPRYAEKLLAYLVTPGKDNFDFEPAYQVRIGEGISWIQKPAVPQCEICGERMRFILQCPGSLLNDEESKQAIYYLFGCQEHPVHLQVVTQYQ